MPRTFTKLVCTTEPDSATPWRRLPACAGRSETCPPGLLIVWRASLALWCGLLAFCSLALAQSPTDSAPVPQPVDFRFAHPDADIKMNLNLQAFLNSPMIAKAITDSAGQAKDNAMQIQMVLGMLRTVDRISVSARQKGAKDMDVLVQVTGSFDSQLIAGLFPSTGTSKVKVVGPHTLLIGEGDSFAAAEGRLSGPAIQDDELEGSDLWISVGSDFLAKQTKQLGNAQAMPLPGMQGISMGVNLAGDAPEINMLLTAIDEAGAGEILKTLQAATGQMMLANPAAGAAAKALSLKQDGARLRMHYVMPPEMIAFGQQLARQQAASGALPAQLAPLLGMFGMGGAAKSPSTPAQTPPNDGTIKIYGLDGGPQEIHPK